MHARSSFAVCDGMVPSLQVTRRTALCLGTLRHILDLPKRKKMNLFMRELTPAVNS